MRVKHSKSQIITLVQKTLDRHQPDDYGMAVARDGVVRSGDTWYVVVEPSREDVRSYDFSARLAEAAAELWDVKGVKIQLTTVLPQYAD